MSRPIKTSLKDTDPVINFCSMVVSEVNFARRKFPKPNPNLAALMEEVGELARALLERRDMAQVYGEAVQVAAMACRCALEGDPQFQKQTNGGKNGK